jgi:hypothetical protein
MRVRTAYNRCLERESRLQIRNVTPFAAKEAFILYPGDP